MDKRTILVVDDQSVNRKILRRLLESDYTILEAENGEIALNVMRENAEKISAILLDIVMPVLDGYGVLQAMQHDSILSKMPVIVSSQKDGDEAEEKALALGAQDFIAKPYKVNIIKRRLTNIIKLRETAAIINRVEKDELTGLLSKQFFCERVNDIISRRTDTKYDIISLGIEHFKLVNDTYGIRTGDNFLRHIADVLNSVKDVVLTSRFTSDQFYMLVIRRDNYDDYFKSILADISNFPIEMDININCGIYQIHDLTSGVNSMCDRAQLASNKNKGRYDQLFSFYDDSMRQKLLNEQFMASNMQAAINEHQFHVYYQPKYDLNNERVAGAEALVRWIHPTKGFMSPGEFIPVFEHNGFITQLDEYVWEAACRDMHEWIEKGYPPIAISVNVSRADVYNPKLTDILLGLIAKYKIPIRYLHLEITESAYTNNAAQIIKVVSNLRKLGFIIEMDDFGSGYSSLNMLSEMPVDILKLDMGFVQNETESKSGEGIMSFVISLAKWLDLSVVAEGVENAAQIATLRSMDCNYVQGFYYAKPMKKEDFDELLNRSNVSEMICGENSAAEYERDERVQPDELSNRVMLIVDDIEINRVVLASAFEGWFKIVEKGNGNDAWEYLQENADNVAIVMLDLLMPVMDGFQLLEHIRSNPKTADIAVIVASQGNEKSEIRALNMDADDFIAKPYNLDIVKHRVHNAIEIRRLQKLMQKNAPVNASTEATADTRINTQKAISTVNSLKPYFDIVRLVNPEDTLVHKTDESHCEMHSCYSVWGKSNRCNNCISLRALHNKSRACKLEYSENGLYFVISHYIPYGKHGAIIEMVTKLDNEYVDNVFDKQLLYTKLDSINEELNIDSLTRAYNRRFIDKNLHKYIQSCITRGKDLGVAMIDIDAFKSLNDLYGHLTGDEALRTVAQMLRDNIAQSKGDFVARYGGDEFMVVCCDIPKDVFVRRLTAVSKLVHFITTADEQQVPISISIGCINISEIENPTSTEIINRADKRLYKSKTHGKGLIISSDR